MNAFRFVSPLVYGSLFALASILASSTFAVAPDPAPPSIFVVPSGPAVDDDFAFQGEFWGQMALPGLPRSLLGLQVIARGNGTFVGRALFGGLPGAGWTDGESLELKGSRQGSFVSLYGPTVRFEVETTVARAIDSEGAKLGQLDRVRRASPTMGLSAPKYATPLFVDGEPVGLDDAQVDEEGLLKVGALTKDRFDSFRLHVEFRTPYMPGAGAQGRGNSGCYLLQSYEVQILDSFGLPGAFNECGSLYRTVPPLVNMCLPPLSWQTYDIFFQAPKWDDRGEKTENSRLTVFQNGQLVQDHLDVPNKTGAGKPESPQLRPILFQNHQDAVAFRNLWIVPGEPNEREIEAIERLSYAPMSVEAFSRLDFSPVSTSTDAIEEPAASTGEIAPSTEPVAACGACDSSCGEVRRTTRPVGNGCFPALRGWLR